MKKVGFAMPTPTGLLDDMREILERLQQGPFDDEAMIQAFDVLLLCPDSERSTAWMIMEKIVTRRDEYYRKRLKVE